MKGESPDPRIPCGPFWLTPERKTVHHYSAGKPGFMGFCLLLTLFLLPLPSSAAALLLGEGPQTNHLLILFAPGQVVQYELRHNGSVGTGADLLNAVIQATGGHSVTTSPADEEGNAIPFSSQLEAWDQQGLFAHFYQYSFGIFVNGFAFGTFSAGADGSWTSYFNYQIGGTAADFISAPVGATDRTLSDGDHDAYVLTGIHSSPGLAAWQAAHGITDLTADPDQDGMNNLFEYALRQHPLVADARGVVVGGRQEELGDSFLTLTYRRPHDEWAAVPNGADAGYDGIGYTVETSADLVTWFSGTNSVTQTVTPDPTGPMATVVARVPHDSPRRFLRLRVHLP